MNIKKAAMMLTIMLITILSASSFYILTGEAELSKNIVVNSTTGIRIEKYHDYEFVYTDKSEDPYTSSSGKKYYVRYTGAESGRTVVDLDEEGYGLTIENGLPIINGTTLTSTYKLFSRRNGGTNTEITRVFIPSSIAIDGDKDTAVLQNDGSYTFDENKGITSNTFEGWNTDTEKDVIYHTGQLTANATGNCITTAHDRTTKISKEIYPHITTYVYLGTENVLRGSGVKSYYVRGYSYGYQGQVKNVFVSNSVNYPAQFFAIETNKTTPLEYALLDTGEYWANNKMGLGLMFYYQTTLKITSNFKMPDEVYQGSNGGYPATRDEWGVAHMFNMCESITQLPSNFKIPKNANNLNYMFNGCKKLRGVIEILDTNNISYVDHFLTDAGTDSTVSNYKKCNTPLIVKYPVTNAVIDNYIANVYTPQTTDGKVTMLPRTSDSDIVNSNWEKVYDEDGEAPNYDEGGAYYIRYKGTYKTVYLDTIERNSNDNVGNDDVINNDYGIDFSAGTKNLCILNTKLRSTYKMFSKREGGVNTEITRVFIPSTIAIKGDESLSSDTAIYNNNGIASNTFDGWNTDIEKDVIYHTGSIGANARGSNITSVYDRTNKISRETYSHITTYVYLGSENISRGTGVLAVGVNKYQYGYYGDVKNVFVSNSFNYPTQFFSIENSSTKTIEYALLDNGDRWATSGMGLGGLFYKQTSLKITSNFRFPNKAYQGNYSNYNTWGLTAMFNMCESITQLPTILKIPEGIKYLCVTFYGCKQLSGIIELPSSATTLTYNNLFFLAGAGTSAQNYPGFDTPIVLVADKTKSVYTQAEKLIDTKYVTLLDINDPRLQSSSENSNPIVVAADATNKIVIEDCTEEISVKVNEVNSQKLTVEDETDLVSVTVNKKVEENKPEEDEIQE